MQLPAMHWDWKQNTRSLESAHIEASPPHSSGSSDPHVVIYSPCSQEKTNRDFQTHSCSVYVKASVTQPLAAAASLPGNCFDSIQEFTSGVWLSITACAAHSQGRGDQIIGWETSLLKVSSFPAAPLPPWLFQGRVEPLSSGSSGCCSAVEISTSIKDSQSGARLVAASQAHRYQLYFYLSPEVLSCRKQCFSVPLTPALF